MPFLLKGEGAVFLVSLMIGYLNADASVKTKLDDYSSKHSFPPCHLLPSPSSSGLRSANIYRLETLHVVSSGLSLPSLFPTATRRLSSK